MKKKMRWSIIGLIIGLLTYVPMWIFFVFKLLKHIKATELIWFLFWAYVSLMIITLIITKIAEGM